MHQQATAQVKEATESLSSASGNGAQLARSIETPLSLGEQSFAARAPLATTQIDFTELEDGSLVELIEDPDNPARTLLVVCKDGDIRYVDKLEYRGQVLVPLQRKDGILRCVRLPRGTKSYKSVESLLREVEFVLSLSVVLPDVIVAVLANFVLSTWLVDRLPVAPYVALAGLPQSGKTTLLKVLGLVCRRPLLTADISSAAFYQACAQLMPTLLIDETGTHGSNRALRHLLRMGTTRDVVAMRKNQSFHTYGAKVICWLEPPDDPALNSRCILIPMTEANNPNLVKPTDPGLEQVAVELRKALLQFRLDNYRTVQPPRIQGAEVLRPRVRDLLDCLAAPCANDVGRCQFLLRFFKFHNAVTQEPLSPPQNAVLNALFVAVHQRANPDAKDLHISELTGWVNDLLKEAGERFHLQPRKVGAVLTSFGFSYRQRTKKGWIVCLTRSDQERVHELARCYGIDRLNDRHLRISPKECPICREMVSKQKT